MHDDENYIWFGNKTFQEIKINHNISMSQEKFTMWKVEAWKSKIQGLPWHFLKILTQNKVCGWEMGRNWEMTQCSRAHTSLAENPGLVPSTCVGQLTTACNYTHTPSPNCYWKWSLSPVSVILYDTGWSFPLSVIESFVDPSPWSCLTSLKEHFVSRNTFVSRNSLILAGADDHYIVKQNDKNTHQLGPF